MEERRFLEITRTVVAAGLVLLALGWYGYFRLYAVAVSPPYSAGMHGNDFKHLYLGAHLLAHGQNPYDSAALFQLARTTGFRSVNPYVYLPFTGLVLAPLTLLGPVGALKAWFFLNHLFLLIAVVLVFRSLDLSLRWENVAGFALGCAIFYPLARTLSAGQLNVALLLLFAMTFLWLRRGWGYGAGAAAGFAFLFKLIPGILLLYFPWSGLRLPGTGFQLGPFRFGIARRHQQAWMSMVATTALLVVFCMVAVGLPVHLAFLPVLSNMGYGQSTWSQFGEHFYRAGANQSFNAFFHHVLVPWEGFEPWLSLGEGWANGLTWLAVVVILGLLLWRSLPVRRFDRSGGALPGARPELVYGGFILLALLAPSIYWDHYAVIALLPLWALYACLERSERVGAASGMVLVAFPLGSFLEWGRLREAAGTLLSFGGGAQSGFVAWMAVLLLGFALVGLAAHVPLLRTVGGWMALLWGVAAGVLAARMVFDLPGFRGGVGLLAMSSKLWGTVLLFGLILWKMPSQRLEER